MAANITIDIPIPKRVFFFTSIVYSFQMSQAANACNNNISNPFLTPNHLLYDLLYNPDTTLFMKKGADQGAVVKNGLEMLLLQAFAAWDIWNE